MGISLHLSGSSTVKARRHGQTHRVGGPTREHSRFPELRHEHLDRLVYGHAVVGQTNLRVRRLFVRGVGGHARERLDFTGRDLRTGRRTKKVLQRKETATTPAELTP